MQLTLTQGEEMQKPFCTNSAVDDKSYKVAESENVYYILINMSQVRIIDIFDMQRRLTCIFYYFLFF